MKRLLLAALLLILLVSTAYAKIGEGSVGLGVMAGGLPTLKYYFADDFAGEAGISIVSSTSSSSSILLRGLRDVMIKDKLRVHVGGGLLYQAVGSSNTTALQVVGGVELFVVPQLSLNIDATLISFSSVAGGSTVTLLSGDNNILSSFKVYLD